ncbi:hypothetical protein KASIA_p103 [Shewanella phage vB_SspS_KASIA]|nr:hypothetical protein KASIA_p103 [Shewanella phage vB_SspS_KASIA]
MSRKLILIPRKSRMEGVYSSALRYGIIPEGVTVKSDSLRSKFMLDVDKVTVFGLIGSGEDNPDNLRGWCFDSIQMHLDVIPMIDDYLLDTIKLINRGAGGISLIS